MIEDKTLKEEVKELKEIMEKFSQENKPKEKKQKEFKIPRRAKINKVNAKKNYVTVLEIGENRNGQFKKYPIQDQTVLIDEIPRLATADNIIMIDGKNPLIVLPKWSVKPTSPSDTKYEFLDLSGSYEEIEKKGLNVKGYKILMDRMKREAISTKKPLPWWIWIVGLAVLGIVIYLIMQK